ncbi:MAG: hypothetical protein Q8L86_07735 [Vicinamibacterales bacterium]|nr:hypothetical protein [Vicinamibacterales bacterium]
MLTLRLPRSFAASLLGLAVLLTAGCTPADPIAILEPVEVVTGWYDAGIMEDGKNKLVPSVSLKLRNKGEEGITTVQINAIFRRVGEEEVWGEHYGWAVQREELQPGDASDAIVLRSTLGYTGIQPRAQMLQNQEFVDAKVELFLKKGSRAWAKFAEYPIQRQVLTR